MSYFRKFCEIELMNESNTYNALQKVCKALTHKHLPRDIFFEVWSKIDYTDWDIHSDTHYSTYYESYCTDRGSFKYKNNKKSVKRLKKMYKNFREFDF